MVNQTATPRLQRSGGVKRVEASTTVETSLAVNLTESLAMRLLTSDEKLEVFAALPAVKVQGRVQVQPYLNLAYFQDSESLQAMAGAEFSQDNWRVNVG